MKAEKSMFKKMLAFVLSTAIIITALPVISLNAFASNVLSGSCGINANWEIDGRVLIITGYGPMNNYSATNRPKWAEYSSSIDSIRIDEGITTIGDYAFYNLKCFENGTGKLTIPNSVVYIGNYAFYGSSYHSGEYVSNVLLPNGLKTIGDYAFYDLKLTSSNDTGNAKPLTIPDSVTSIGKYAFAKEIVHDDSRGTKIEIIPGNVKTIGDGAFCGCDILELTIEYGVETIGANAFSSCRISKLSLADSITEIGQNAFSGTGNNPNTFEAISLPTGLTRIMNDFLPASVASVYIPNTVTSIAQNVFYKSGLRDIYYDGTQEKWNMLKTNLRLYSTTVVHCLRDENTYSISYNANGGTAAPGDQTGSKGYPITLSSSIPTRTGYTFLGWSVNKTAANAQYGPGDTFIANEDTTLYAVWINTLYKVTYDAYGGQGAPTAQTKSPGENLVLSERTPTRADYRFLGWSTGKTGHVNYKPGDIYSEDNDITLYAVWQSQIWVDYSEDLMIYAIQNGDINYGSKRRVILDHSEYIGEIIIDWGDPDNWNNLYLTKDTYLIWTGVYNSGTIGTPISVKPYSIERYINENGHIVDKVIYDDNPPCADYIEIGSSGMEEIKIYRTSTDIYTIAYNANGGLNAPSIQYKKHGIDLTLSSTKPTRDGYTFIGWTTSDNSQSVEFTAGDYFSYNADTTLYAVWKANTYTVTYNANGGFGAPAVQDEIYGSVITLSSEKPTRENYTFLGWSTSSTATDSEYSAGALFSVYADTTLYAVWAINTYSVTYYANKGTGAPAMQTKTHGVDLLLSTVEPTRQCYVFLGWSENKNALQAEYSKGDVYTIDSPLTLYAIWALNSDSKAHIWNNGIVTKAPTCTENGVRTYTCTVCGATEYENIEALGHNYSSEWTIDIQPSCTTAGEKSNHCSRCDARTSITMIAANGHLWDTGVISIAANCTEGGIITYTCKSCGLSMPVAINPLGHDLIHHDGKAATCNEIGWEAYDTCSRCDYTTYVEIPALGHDLIHHDAKAATCPEHGWEEYDTCSRCDYTNYVEIPALGHDLVHHDAKTPTFTEVGWHAYDTCTRCDYSTYIEIPTTANGISIAASQMSTDGKSIRFIAAVEGLDFAEVGFTVSITNAEGRTETVTVADKTVYKALTYNGTTLTSEDFGIENGYLFVLVIENIPSDFSVSVTPFARETSEQGGARVAAQVRDFAIKDKKASILAE